MEEQRSDRGQQTLGTEQLLSLQTYHRDADMRTIPIEEDCGSFFETSNDVAIVTADCDKSFVHLSFQAREHWPVLRKSNASAIQGMNDPIVDVSATFYLASQKGKSCYRPLFGMEVLVSAPRFQPDLPE